ncbi:MAG: zinc ribbon domain-containing protein [Nitrospirae bacterium]|nr:MAG: zinc ribbon domain-containing protein [Nitrospirota bacterium]
MPIYEYGCAKCKKHLEVMQKMTDKPLEKCPDCGGRLKKKISNTSFVLKGTGWYATDYGTGKKKDEGAPKKGGKSKETKTEGVEKPAAATETKEAKTTEKKETKASSAE